MPDLNHLLWRAEGTRQFLHLVFTLFCGGVQRQCEAYMGPGDSAHRKGPMVRTFQGRTSPDPEIPCVLVSEDAGRRIFAALQGGPLYVKIHIERNESFQAFRRNVALGHRVRMALLAESIIAKPGMGVVDFQEYFFRNM
eukprot:g22774.t1